MDDDNPLTDMLRQQFEERKQREAKLEMEVDANSHRLASTLDHLDREQLQAVHDLFGSVASSKDPGSLAALMLGMITGLLHVKFGRCWACGKDHDQELRQAIGPDS